MIPQAMQLKSFTKQRVVNVMEDSVRIYFIMLILFIFDCDFSSAKTVDCMILEDSSNISSLNSNKISNNDNSCKWRILVDKVLMKSNNWVITKNHIREIKEAGFNVISPRKGGTDLRLVREVSQYADEIGIKYIAWIRGSLPTSSGIQYVHSDGVVQPIFSPNSEELWDWMEKVIIGHAMISIENPSMIGTFIDFENYAIGRKGHGMLYNLSYDLKIFSEFAKFKGLLFPLLDAKDRKSWLKRNNLYDEFEKFQIDSWRTRARKLHKKVNQINPEYIFIVYPAPKTYFLTHVLLPEWASTDSPLILADASTYGRKSASMPIQFALSENKDKLNSNQLSVANYGTKIRYLGGIDPGVTGADPEFSGLNAKMILSLVDGYWVFYEGVEYDGSHKEYFDSFRKINVMMQ